MNTAKKSPVSATAPIPAPRKFANKKPQQTNFLTTLREAGGFLIAVGLLITAMGVICFVGFHNLFSMLVLDLGLITVLSGFAIKMIDIFLKILGGRS